MIDAPEVVAAIEALGIRLRVVGGRPDLEGGAEPPAELLEELQKQSATVFAYLQERGEQPGPVKVLDRREEITAPRRGAGVYDHLDAHFGRGPSGQPLDEQGMITLEAAFVVPDGGPRDDGTRWFAGPGGFFNRYSVTPETRDERAQRIVDQAVAAMKANQ